MAVDKASARDRVSGAKCSRELYEASSIMRESGRCRSGTLISSTEDQSGFSAARARSETALARWEEKEGWLWILVIRA